MTSPSVCPTRSSITKYGIAVREDCPKSVICTTFGCCTLAVAFASWMKRAREILVAREVAAQHLHREGTVERHVAHS